MKLKNFKNKLIAFLIMLLGFVISSFAQNSNCHPNVCQDFGNTDLLQVYEAVKEQSAATITVTAGQTFVDSIALGVTEGNNQSNNAKETTLNIAVGALDNSLDSLSNIDNNTKIITITPTYSFITGAGNATIAAGNRFFSIANIGTNTATVSGATLPAGVTFSFPPTWNAVYGQLIYNARLSTLIIIQSK